jgi:hypothetical protein
MPKSEVIDNLEFCEECLSRGFHERKCSQYVDLAREENKRAIREDIKRDFDRDPDWGNLYFF